MSTSDFVTLIGRRDQNRVSVYQDEQGLALSPGDVSNSKRSDLQRILEQQGGISVQVTSPKSSRPTVVVRVWNSAGYQPPTQLLVLRKDDSREQKEIRPERMEIGLESGDRVLLPLDLNSQPGLVKLQEGLQHLPPDYESIVMNAIRRPSLEARLELLEQRLDRLTQGKGTSAKYASDDEQPVRSNWFGEFLAHKWILALLLVVVLGTGLVLAKVLNLEIPWWKPPDLESTRAEAIKIASNAKTTAVKAQTTAKSTSQLAVTEGSTLAQKIRQSIDDARKAAAEADQAAADAKNATDRNGVTKAKAAAEAAGREAEKANGDADAALNEAVQQANGRGTGDGDKNVSGTGKPKAHGKTQNTRPIATGGEGINNNRTPTRSTDADNAANEAQQSAIDARAAANSADASSKAAIKDANTAMETAKNLGSSAATADANASQKAAQTAQQAAKDASSAADQADKDAAAAAKAAEAGDVKTAKSNAGDAKRQAKAAADAKVKAAEEKKKAEDHRKKVENAKPITPTGGTGI